MISPSRKFLAASHAKNAENAGYPSISATDHIFSSPVVLWEFLQALIGKLRSTLVKGQPLSRHHARRARSEAYVIGAAARRRTAQGRRRNTAKSKTSTRRATPAQVMAQRKAEGKKFLPRTTGLTPLNGLINRHCRPAPPIHRSRSGHTKMATTLEC